VRVPDCLPAVSPVSAPEVGDLCLALFGVFKALRQAGQGGRPLEVLRRHGLAPRHVVVLAYLALTGPMSVSEIAERIGVALTTASLLVADLATASLVSRDEDAMDHRRTIVSLSLDSGDEISALLDARLSSLRRAAARLGPVRLAELTTGLQLLREELAVDSLGTSIGLIAGDPA